MEHAREPLPNRHVRHTLPKQIVLVEVACTRDFLWLITVETKGLRRVRGMTGENERAAKQILERKRKEGHLHKMPTTVGNANYSRLSHKNSKGRGNSPPHRFSRTVVAQVNPAQRGPLRVQGGERGGVHGAVAVVVVVVAVAEPQARRQMVRRPDVGVQLRLGGARRRGVPARVMNHHYHDALIMVSSPQEKASSIRALEQERE